MPSSVPEIYGHRIRMRVCGLLIKENALLLVNHKTINSSDFWAPPGGGIEFGETAENALARELKEETGLTVNVCDFLFACEFINRPLHAIELFFRIEWKEGHLRTGYDPESGNNQIISDVRFLKWDQIGFLPAETRHGIFEKTKKPEEITLLRGYFKL